MSEFYKMRCEYLEKIIKCHEKLVDEVLEKMKIFEEIIKDQTAIINSLDNYVNKLKNDIREMTIENDTLKINMRKK